MRSTGCLCYHTPGWGSSLMLGFLPASLGSPAGPRLGNLMLPAQGAPMPRSFLGRSDAGSAISLGKEDAVWFEVGPALVTHVLLCTGAEWVKKRFFAFALHICFTSTRCGAAVKHLLAWKQLMLQKARCVGPWEGAARRRRGQQLSPPWPMYLCSPGIRFAVVLPGHNVLKQLPAGDPERKRESRAGPSQC